MFSFRVQMKDGSADFRIEERKEARKLGWGDEFAMSFDLCGIPGVIQMFRDSLPSEEERRDTLYVMQGIVETLAFLAARRHLLWRWRWLRQTALLEEIKASPLRAEILEDKIPKPPPVQYPNGRKNPDGSISFVILD